MNKYKCVARFGRIVSGTVELTEKQASKRKSSIRKLEGNSYSVVSVIGFKNGEVIGYEGQLKSSDFELVSDPDELPGDNETLTEQVEKDTVDVDDEEVPEPTQSKESFEMKTLKSLRELAKKKGLNVTTRSSKQEILDALDSIID